MTEADNLAALAERANHNTPEGHKAYEMFCATVWSLYRAGRIAVIDDEAVERVKDCIHSIEKRATVQPEELGNAEQLAINCDKVLGHLAELRTAIAALETDNG